ncbi:hypothetical protein [Saccharothrix stipae]
MIESPDAYIDELSVKAQEQLDRIRVQESHSVERSVTVKLSGSALPIGVDAGGKRGTTRQDRPMGYPELVENLKEFLKLVRVRYEVVVGVDELDKLRSAEEVENFLNEIKVIFRTPGCYFLVSVSEDAAAGFERRGVPFRDVFDSSFDDVLSMSYLDFPSARKVLYGLLLGWTQPFVALAYVTSGGLARDLIRSTREIVDQCDSDNRVELAAVASRMCRREAEARLRAVRHELMRDPDDPRRIDLLIRVADYSFTDATAADFHTRHQELARWVGEQQAEAAGAVCLARELAAVMLFAATVIEFFDPSVIADRLGRAEVPPGGRLAVPASARQTLAANPRMSLAGLDRFRTAWRLDDRGQRRDTAAA